jgi:hypothetical protein
LYEAVHDCVRGQQVDVTLETDAANGKLLSFIESRTHVSHREFTDGRACIQATMGKKMLADLSRNEQVEVKSVTACSPGAR